MAPISHAQISCPPGTIAYGTDQSTSVCGPAPRQARGNSQQQQAPVRWESRWGAIATDGKVGALGTSMGLETQQAAERAAMADCAAKGGPHCEIEVSFSNGCGAMVVGQTTHNSNYGTTLDEATAKALKTCNAADRGCRVFYSGCSLPRAIQ
ncbi:DUF4189 domain-containing protein [Burkholderia sp. MSMB1459WGS]|uniref:DUF4189 domain-containing protein n=1 Tax=Burkholderia sp. MSMB1459WGS TaxID=1637970 RepID=UPI0009E8D2F7|nr:DUF4189 domain-containing protein [Burkholderia sp. MSMB1459WGS]